MRNLIQGCETAIAIVSRDGEISYINSSLKEKFGLDMGDNIKKIFKSDDKEIFFNNIMSLADKGKEYSNFMRFVKESGELVFCWLHIFRIDEGYVFEIFDLTPVEKRSSTISDSSYVKILKYMSQGISHSIRNPIMSAGGMLSRLKGKIKDDCDVDRIINYVEIVEKSLHRIISIIANLEVVSNSLPVSLEKVDVSDVVFSLKNSYDEKVRFDVVEKEKVYVYVSKMHLGFMIDEILKNSLDALEGVKSPRIEVIIYSEGKNGVIEIVDNGKGMDEDEVPLITIPFYSTKPSNMGIGLSLVKFLIEGYGGSISLKSEKKKGTKVCLFIPIEKRADIRVKKINA